ncbi:MAG: hypothetical protein ACKV2T_29900 [Kofleriaceae bacterium]
MSVGGPDDQDESTIDSELPPPPSVPRAPNVPLRQPASTAMSTRPIPRSQAPDFDDDGDFEGDDPPTTAEPVREDHLPQITPRSPSIPTRPVPKFRPTQTDDAFDDDANPTMFDPHVPTGAPRASFDPHRIDDNRRTADLSGAARRVHAGESPRPGTRPRALEPTADLGPAARRALAEGSAPDPKSRDAIQTAPIRKTPIAADPLTTAPMGSGAIAASSSPPPRRGPRNPPSPTGPMLRPPPDAPPSLAPNEASAAGRPAPTQRASSPVRAIPPSAPPAFVTDRRAARSGQQPVVAPPGAPVGPPVELVHTIPDPPYAPTPLRAVAPAQGLPSQAAPTMLQRPAQTFDPQGRIDDSSRTNRWEGRSPGQPPEPFTTPYAPTDQSYPPPPPAMHAVSHKSPDGVPRPAYDHRPVPQVQIRSMANLSKTPAGGMGRLAPPHDPNVARTRKAQDLLIWGSVVVIIGSVVTLMIWLIAR